MPRQGALWAASLLLLFLSPALFSESGREELARGKALFLEGRYDQAVETLLEALSHLPDPDSRVDARLTLALIRQAQGDDPRALAELQWALSERADLKLDADLYSPKTISLLEKARAGGFERYLSAKKLFAAGELVQALEGFRLAANLLRDEESERETVLDALLNAALIQQTTGEIEASRSAFRQAIMLRPELDLNPDFYAPSTVAIFRGVKEAGTLELDGVRSALAAGNPVEAKRRLQTAQTLLLTPEQQLRGKLLGAYAGFLTGERETSSRELQEVLSEKPELALDETLFDSDFRIHADNLRLIIQRGLPRIAIVQSSTSVVHELARRGFVSTCRANYQHYVLPRDEETIQQAHQDFDVIYALGKEAVDQMGACCSTSPVIAANIPSVTWEQDPQAARGAVLWKTSLAQQVPVALRALPTIRRIGAIAGKQGGEALLNELEEALVPHGVELVKSTIASDQDASRAVSRIAEQVDLFWYLPDPALASVETFRAVLDRCHSNRIPVFAFHESLVKAGAFVGVSADFVSLGSQAGSMAIRFLTSRDKRSLLVMPAAANRVVINLQAAETLGIKPDPNLISLAAAVYH